MPVLGWLFLAATTGGFIATAAAGTANKTVPQTTTRPADGGVNDVVQLIKIPLLIAGTIIAIKVGSKYAKKL